MICYLLLTRKIEKFLSVAFSQFSVKYEMSFSFFKVFAWNIRNLIFPNL